MSVRLVVRPQAEAELLAARDWYETQRPGLGQKFVDEVRDAMSAVATRPLSFPKVHGEMVEPSFGGSRTACSFE